MSIFVPDSFITHPASGDPLYSDVVLLLHGENVGGSIIDSSPFAHVPVSVGASVSFDTGLVKFGSSDLKFTRDGSSQNAIRYANTNFFINQQFCVEAWVYLSRDMYGDGSNPNHTICGIQRPASGNDSWGFYVTVTQINATLGIAKYALNFRYSTNGTNSFQIGADLSAGAYIPDGWYHLAVTRNGTGANQVRLFQGGDIIGLGTITGNLAGTSSSRFAVGAYSTNTGTTYAGMPMVSTMSEVRITKRARYTATFTPPTAAFPDSA